jgi:hypothetical protein
MPKTKGYSIREATQDDFYNLLIFSKEFHGNSHLKDLLEFSPKKTGELLETAINREDFTVFLLENGKELVGGLICMAADSFFSEDRQSICLAWYIRKEHRSLKNAIGLVNGYEEWSKTKGVKLINIINVKLETPRAFEKLGYKMTEVTFSKEVQ